MMRVSRRLFATASSVSSKAGKSPQVALLPPLHLYRRLLRVHRRKLPPDMRLLGDEYVKNEFRAHRNIDNPIHIVSFPSMVVQTAFIRGKAWLTTAHCG